MSRSGRRAVRINAVAAPEKPGKAIHSFNIDVMYPYNCRVNIHHRTASCDITPAGVLNVTRNENFGKLRAGYLFPEVRIGIMVGCWRSRYGSPSTTRE